MQKIIFKIETTGTIEELNAHIVSIAKSHGWQEKVQKFTTDGQPMNHEDGRAQMIDNHITAKDIVLISYLEIWEI